MGQHGNQFPFWAQQNAKYPTGWECNITAAFSAGLPSQATGEAKNNVVPVIPTASLQGLQFGTQCTQLQCDSLSVLI